MTERIILFSFAAAAGWLLDRLHFPVAWLLGPLIAGVIYVGFRRGPRPLHSTYQIVGQALLGLSSGVSFPLATLRAVGTHAAPLVLAVVITAGLSLLNGYLLWRWAGVDRATGFMGSLPGAASSMVAMSNGMGADTVTVAVLQYLRMLLVVFLVPVAVGWMFAPGAGAGEGVVAMAAAAPFWLNLLFLSVCGALGALGGRALKLPSPTFLGPFLVALLLSWTLPLSFHMPALGFSVGLLLMGTSIGAQFDIPMARKLARAALIETGLVVVLIAASLLVGYGFHLATGVSTVTAVLGSTPGGMEVMVASALNLGGDAGLVLAMQMVRWLLILLVGPWVAVRLVSK